ncbi:hypothetical protein BCR44DRAFT_1535948 [Catenaria anguillulae PL171]|uniref:Uncharacterized protein n=1 Tax=Catenaria anguillulae PL171 TaxID=765915 RepID=A0A1Y2GX10_9FUNG|nr:hypothetical protein BCR44DRAFT_1535948 [Catenaria anguillulae PL171]
MALYPTSPHELTLFALSNHLDICPPVSIVSDDWKMGLTGPTSQSIRGQDSPFCLGLDRRIADQLVRKPIPRYDFLEPPGIAWLDPKSLIPHEPTSPTHLKRLITYLRDLDDDALLPTIIVTRSITTHGHHRWQSSLALNIPRVPCWVVDDTRADASPDTLLPVPHTQFWNATSLYQLVSSQDAIPNDAYSYYRVRVYDTRSYSTLRIRDIAEKAREAHRSAAGVGFGVKGTKHVAIRVPTLASAPVLPVINMATSGSAGKSGATASPKADKRDRSTLMDAVEAEDEEVRLEKVAPLIEWGLWKSAGDGHRPKTLGGVNVAELRPIYGLGEAGMSLAHLAESVVLSDDGEESDASSRKSGHGRRCNVSPDRDDADNDNSL